MISFAHYMLMRWEHAWCMEAGRVDPTGRSVEETVVASWPPSPLTFRWEGADSPGLE